MDFMIGLPKSKKGNDAVWVIVDRLTKFALFLPVKMTYSVDKLTRIFINEVVRLHGISISIVSDRDPRFTSKLCLKNALGIRLKLTLAYHPQINGQLERTIQILENVLRAYILELRGH
jgi:transposase InsO family protein